jgi:hypothetical protein
VRDHDDASSECGEASQTLCALRALSPKSLICATSAGGRETILVVEAQVESAFGATRCRAPQLAAITFFSMVPQVASLRIATYRLEIIPR